MHLHRIQKLLMKSADIQPQTYNNLQNPIIVVALLPNNTSFFEYFLQDASLFKNVYKTQLYLISKQLSPEMLQFIQLEYPQIRQFAIKEINSKLYDLFGPNDTFYAFNCMDREHIVGKLPQIEQYVLNAIKLNHQLKQHNQQQQLLKRDSSRQLITDLGNQSNFSLRISQINHHMDQIRRMFGE